MKAVMHAGLKIQLSFYSPADKQLFPSKLWPGLPQEDAADHSQGSIP